MIGSYEHPLSGISYGDARELGKQVESGSVDLILTDPPYLKEYLHCYDWLGKWGARVLKDGGWLIAYAATEHLITELNALDRHLDYFWVFILNHKGGYPRLWKKKLMSGYKPVLVFTKGDPSINPWMATIHSDRKDKRFHQWGQGMGFAEKMIDRLTPPDGLVVDPFCGGGTVAEASIFCKRRFMAFEIDPDAYTTAINRIRTMQLPLF